MSTTLAVSAEYIAKIKEQYGQNCSYINAMRTNDLQQLATFILKCHEWYNKKCTICEVHLQKNYHGAYESIINYTAPGNDPVSYRIICIPARASEGNVNRYAKSIKFPRATLAHVATYKTEEGKWIGLAFFKMDN